MGEFIVVAFKEPYMADALRTRLKEIDEDTVLELEDTAAIVRAVDGTLNIAKDLDSSSQLPIGGAAYFGFVGAVFGWILADTSLGGALFGLQAGVLLGWISGAIASKILPIGLPAALIKQVAEGVPAGSSAACIMAKRPFTDERIIAELKKFDGVILNSTLAPAEEATLKAAMAV